MAQERLSSTVGGSLLIGLLLIVGLVLAGLGSAVMLPQGGAVVLVLAGAALLFLGLQLLIFKLMGLRSGADHEPAAGQDPAARAEEHPVASGDAPHGERDEAAEWRAWRG